MTPWAEPFWWTGTVPTPDVDNVLGVAEVNAGTYAVEKMIIPPEVLATVEEGTPEINRPIGRDLVDPAALRGIRGTVVPPRDSANGAVGIAVVYRLKLSGPGTLTWRGTRVRYHVGERHYVVDVPVSYKVCSAHDRRHLKRFRGCLPPRAG